MTHDTTHISLLARADLLLLSARLLGPPESALVTHASEDLRTLARRADPSHADTLAATLHAVAEAARATDPAAWRHERTRLFEGPVACPINETAYVRRDKGVIIADLCGFYRAFGFQPSARLGEKPDHLACELEFTAVLMVMLAQARRSGCREDAEVTRDAARAFLEEHLAEWLALACGRLETVATLPLYTQIAAVLRSVWDLLADGFELPNCDALDTSYALGTGDALMDETPYECGMAEDETPFVPITATAQPRTTLGRP